MSPWCCVICKCHFSQSISPWMHSEVCFVRAPVAHVDHGVLAWLGDDDDVWGFDHDEAVWDLDDDEVVWDDDEEVALPLVHWDAEDFQDSLLGAMAQLESLAELEALEEALFGGIGELNYDLLVFSDSDFEDAEDADAVEDSLLAD